MAKPGVEYALVMGNSSFFTRGSPLGDSLSTAFLASKDHFEGFQTKNDLVGYIKALIFHYPDWNHSI